MGMDVFGVLVWREFHWFIGFGSNKSSLSYLVHVENLEEKSLQVLHHCRLK